ncbi:YbjC family protein [Klebsiella pneumoniae]|uniref:YbjC family protein n=1 Tax=Klebsiella pneumoniae TaxID=573 RepID=UPI00300A5087
MRKFAPLPKSILLVEILGMGLLTLAWLSLNQYVQLPAPIASPTAALVMLFAGIVLMIPAALVVMWRMERWLRSSSMVGVITFFSVRQGFRLWRVR